MNEKLNYQIEVIIPNDYVKRKMTIADLLEILREQLAVDNRPEPKASPAPMKTK